MKKLFKTLAVSLLAILLVASALSCVSCTATESAKTLFQKGISRTSDKLENIDVVGTTEKIITGGSVEFIIDDLKIDEDTTGNASLKLYANADKKTAAAILSAKVGDEKYDAAAYISSSAAVVKFEKLLGKTAYGVNFAKAEKNLKGSAFNPDSDSDYALSEEMYNELLNAIKLYNEIKSAEKEANKLAEKYIKKLYSLLGKYATYEKENTETTVLAERDVACTLVTVKIDETCLSKTISELWKEAKKDSSLKKFLSERVLAFTKFEDIGELYEKMGDTVDEMLDSLEDSSVNYTVKYYLNKTSGAIMKAEVSTKVGSNKVAYGIELGTAMKKFEGVKVYQKNGSYTQYVWLKVVEDTKEELKLSLESENVKGIPELTVKYTKKEGTVKITTNYGGDETTIKLNYKKKSSTYTFVLESLTVDGEKVEIPGKVTVIVNTKAKAPSAPSKYTDIFSMKEDAFEDFVDDVKENAEDITIPGLD